MNTVQMGDFQAKTGRAFTWVIPNRMGQVWNGYQRPLTAVSLFKKYFFVFIGYIMILSIKEMFYMGSKVTMS